MFDTRHTNTTNRQVFENACKVIIGLERMILETVGFDFRTRYPQKLLAKTIRAVLAESPASDTSPRSFFTTAYEMSIDMYKTFVPIKRTTFAMVSAVTELTALVLSPPPHPHGSDEEEGGEEQQNGNKRKREEDKEENELVAQFRAFALRKHGPAGRHVVLESMLDLLDLYVQHPKATRLGVIFDINHFMDIKIHLNQELEASSLSRHLGHCPRCEFAATAGTGGPPLPPPPPQRPRQHHVQNSVITGNFTTQLPSRPPIGPTMRFVFDPETAREERETADTFFKEEFEEYEIEVEEPIPPPPPAAPHAPRRERDEGDGGGRGRRFHGRGGGHGRDRWGGGGGHYRGDRRRGRRH